MIVRKLVSLVHLLVRQLVPPDSWYVIGLLLHFVPINGSPRVHPLGPQPPPPLQISTRQSILLSSGCDLPPNQGQSDTGRDIVWWSLSRIGSPLDLRKADGPVEIGTRSTICLHGLNCYVLDDKLETDRPLPQRSPEEAEVNRRSTHSPTPKTISICTD